MHMPESSRLVSVIITCYNYGRYLDFSIESALSQTYPDIEVIVVNDGSTDNTDEVVAKYLSDPRIIYIKQKNAGQANAKNTGIRHSKGAFLAFLDADDIWDPKKLEKQMPLFEPSSVGVVYCRAKYIDQDSAEFEYEMKSKYLQPRRGNVIEWLLLDNFIQFSSSVVRRISLEQSGSFDESLKMGIDWDLWLRISTAWNFDFVYDKLFYYRMGHADQMSKNMLERQRCSDRIIETFLTTYPCIVSRQKIRQAFALTSCSRGDYFRSSNLRKSIGYFIKAIVMNPGEIAAYKGIVKSLLYSFGLKS